MVRDLRRSVEAWRSRRYAALRRPMSWLSLVGLDWLGEGVNRLGSAPDNDVQLVAGPAFAGTIALADGVARATSAPDGALRMTGDPVRDLRLVADADATGEPPTTLEVDALRLRLIRRGADGERLAIRSWNTESRALGSFDGIAHWPVDPAWAVEARFEPALPGATIPVPDVIGDLVAMPTPGSVSFEIGGIACRLAAVEGGDAGELWLIFSDVTSGTLTYGGGRFLYTDPPRADGTLTVDFNRAYNPPCVFSPFATCPLPPAGNRLIVRIEAGEQDYQVGL